MDALLSDQDLGLSYPAAASAASSGGDGADLPAITVHRAGWRPAPMPAPVAPVPQDATAPVQQPTAPSPIGDAIPGSTPVVAPQFGGATASPASPPAPSAAGAPPKLLSDDDLGIAPPKDPGTLTNAPDDSLALSAAKGAATTVIKGLSHIPGMFGDAMDFGDYLIARGIAKVTGRPVEDILKEEAAATKKGGWTDPRNWLPSGQQIAAPVLNATGEYVPTSQPGKLLMAGGETALGALGAGGGLAHLATNALAGAAGQEVSDVTQDPLLGAVAGMATAPLAHGGVVAVKKVAGPAVLGVPGIDRVPVIGPAVAAARDNAAASQIVGQSSDPAALIQWAKSPVEPSLTSGVPQTTAAAVGTDRGLFQAEKDARNADNVPFNAIDASQSQAHQAAIVGAQPAGDVFRPGQVITDQANRIDQAAQAATDRLEAAHQDAVTQRAMATQAYSDDQRAALADRTIARGQASGDEKAAADAAAQAAHDRLVQRFQAAHDQASQTAVDAAAPLSQLPPPEQTGAILRTAQQEATNAAKEAKRALFHAVDPDGTLATVVTPLKQAKDAIKAAIDPYAGVQPEGAEGKIWSDIDRMPDVVPFKSLQKLDSRVTAAMADARRNPNPNDPEAIARLTQLKTATMAAIHDGVENQRAHEANLVQRGLLSPENTIDARYAGFLTSYFERQQQAGLAAAVGRADDYRGAGGSSSVSSVERARGGAGQGLRDNRGAEGTPAADGSGTGQPQVGATFGQQSPALGDRTVSAQMHAPETAAALGQDVPGTVVRPFSGPLDPHTNLPQGIVAYHGTPHDFDKFDLSKIGTGEGNQAFGHGLYFAENPTTAESYRDSLSPSPVLSIDGRVAPSGTAPHFLPADERAAFNYARSQGVPIYSDAHMRDLIDYAGARNEYASYPGAKGMAPQHVAGLEKLMTRQRSVGYPDAILNGQDYNRADLSGATRDAFDHIVESGSIDAAINEARTAAIKSARANDQAGVDRWTQRESVLQSFKDQGFRRGAPGNVLQVRLNRDPDHFLDWERPLSKQSDYVKQALASDPAFQKAVDDHLSGYGRGLDPVNANGGSLYAGLSTAAGGDSAATSRLRQAGIAGVKYLDSGSRGAGTGTRNYVAFRDGDIQVTHKNGVPLVRPVSLPDYLNGQASAAFSQELTDAGMSHAAFSPELQSRAGRLLADGRTVDHGKALEKSAIGRAPQEDASAIFGGSASSDGGSPSRSGETGAAQRDGPRGAGEGLRQPGEAGGAPREDLRPNFDPAATERLNAAKAANATYQQTFRNPTVKGALDTNGFAGQYKTPDSAIPGKWVVPGDRGYETAQAFLQASNSDPRAVAAMQDAALAPLRKNLPPIGTVHPNALARWKQAYGGALRALDEVSPGFSNRFDNAANATQAVLDLGAQQKAALQDAQRQAAREATIANLQRREALGQANNADRAQVAKLLAERAADDRAAVAQSRASTNAGIAAVRGAVRDFRDSAAGQFVGKVGGAVAPTEVENTVGGLLKTGTDGVARMRSLVSSISGDADALAGLRKAGVDWMLRSFQNADGSLSGAKFISFVRNNRDVLKELYPTSQVSMFGAIADRIEADAKWRTETAIKAGSDTAKNIRPMLEKAVDETKKHISIAGAATAGFIAGGPKGAATGAALFLLNHLRSSGIKSVNDLYREALLNPEVARYLISKMPEQVEGGKLRALAGLLRRNLVMGDVQTQSASAGGRNR